MCWQVLMANNFGYAYSNNGISGSTISSNNHVYAIGLVGNPIQRSSEQAAVLHVYKKVNTELVFNKSFTLDIPFRMMFSDQTIANELKARPTYNHFLGAASQDYDTAVDSLSHIEIPLNAGHSHSIFYPGRLFTLRKSYTYTHPQRVVLTKQTLNVVSGSILLDPDQSTTTSDIFFILAHTRVTQNFSGQVLDYTIPVLLKYRYTKATSELQMLEWTYPFSQIGYMDQFSSRSKWTVDTKDYAKKFIPGFWDTGRQNVWSPISIGCMSSMCLDANGKLYITTVVGRKPFIDANPLLNISFLSNTSWYWCLHTVSLDSNVDLTLTPLFSSLIQNPVFNDKTFPIMSLSNAATTDSFFIAMSFGKCFEFHATQLSTMNNVVRQINETSYASQLHLTSDGDLLLVTTTDTKIGVYKAVKVSDSLSYLASDTTRIYKYPTYASALFLTAIAAAFDDISSASSDTPRLNYVSFVPDKEIYPKCYPYSSDKSVTDLANDKYLGFYVTSNSSSYIYLTVFYTGITKNINNVRTYLLIGHTPSRYEVRHLDGNQIVGQSNGEGFYSCKVSNPLSGYTQDASTISFTYYNEQEFSLGNTAIDIYWNDPLYNRTIDDNSNMRLRVQGCTGIYSTGPGLFDIDAAKTYYSVKFYEEDAIYNPSKTAWAKHLRATIQYNILDGNGTKLNSSDISSNLWARNYDELGNFDLDMDIKLNTSLIPNWGISSIDVPCSAMLTLASIDGFKIPFKHKTVTFNISPPDSTAGVSSSESGKTISSSVIWTPTGIDSNNIIKDFKVIKNGYTERIPSFSSAVTRSVIKGDVIKAEYVPSYIIADITSSGREGAKSSTPEVYCVKDHQYCLDVDDPPALSFSNNGSTYSSITDELKNSSKETSVHLAGGTTAYFKITFNIIHGADDVLWAGLDATHLPTLKNATFGVIKRSDFYNRYATKFREAYVPSSNYPTYPNVNCISSLIGLSHLINLGSYTQILLSGITDKETINVDINVPVTDRYILVLGCQDQFDQTSLWCVSNVAGNYKFAFDA